MGVQESLARAEGLDWLDGLPESRAPMRLRALASVGRALGRACGLAIRVHGLEHAPASGTILAIGGHRSWIDAPLVVGYLPLEPRIWYLGSGEATFRHRSRERFMRWIGGIVPVYRGGTDIDVHVAAARAVLEAGAVFGIFPEGTRSGESDRLRSFRRGVGLIALRTGVPITPAALGGTQELYRGRRIGLRLLPTVSALDLGGLTAPPAPGSSAELEAARRVTAALEALLEPHFRELAERAADPPSRPRRWRWMTGLIR
jgi:1-acyl-sn-glycerol-3-phosphate acyltransferase